KVVFAEVGAHVSGELTSILGGDVEVELAAGVGGEGFTQVPGELGQVLMGEHQTGAVGARFGEHVVDPVGQGQEVLCLVQVNGQVRAVGVALASTGEHGVPHLGQQQRAEQGRGVFTQNPFG